MQGIVQSVQSRPGGGYPLGDTPAGATVLAFADAAAFDPDGGQVSIEGTVLDYASADLDNDTITLAAGLPFAVAEDDFVATVPATEDLWAVVALGDDIVTAEVPHHLKPLLLPGERTPGEGEAVLVEQVSPGSYRIEDVIGSRAAIDAAFIENADELLLADMKTLGEKLGEAAAERAAAAGRLDAAEGLLGDAFDQIDLKPDQAYVDAAKQQAIDAAAIDAQAKADAAEDAAVAAAASALQTAEQELADAIASGDQAAIAAAQTKADAARDAAIAAAATDASTKADAAREAAITAAAADATAKAAEAMTKANAALTAAQSAQATADNAIRTYYSANPPWANGSTQPDDVLGDMWFDLDDGQAYRWSGTSWVVIRDQGIGEALAAAQSAQTTADGKITAFYQPNEPLEGDEGDLWFDTDNGNRVYRRAGTSWVDVADARIAAQASALVDLQGDLTGLEGKVDGKAVIHYQPLAPTDLTEADKGDIWIDSDASPKTFKSWSGTAWVDVTDATAIDALAKVQTKTTTYQTSGTTAPTAPAGGFTTGDLWVDSNGKIARWSGSAWVTSVDPKTLANNAQAAAITAARQAVLAAEASADNKVVNPGFELGLDGWTHSGNPSTGSGLARSGAKYVVFGIGTPEIASSPIAVQPGEVWRYGYWHRGLIFGTGSGTASGGLRLQTSADGATWTSVTSSASGPTETNVAPATAVLSDWAEQYREFTVPTGVAYIRVRIAIADAAGALYFFDDVYARNFTEVKRLEQLANQVLIDAKAFATTKTDGVAKSVWSTALPGTTRLPQNSTWYQHDSAGDIIAVFNQTAASSGTTHGNTWVASSIRSEAIHNLDLGKLTVAGDATLQQAVINSLVAQIAAFVKADIGNLTVTGTSNLNEVVAERIWGNIATFAQITADKILAGYLQATIGIATGGAIVAGDPAGRAAELTDEGLVLYDVVDSEEGGRRISSRLGGEGADELALLDETGEIIGGIDADGVVTGSALQVGGEAVVGGTPLLGTLIDPTADEGWLDQFPRGIVAKLQATSNRVSRAADEDWGYVVLPFTALPLRMYRITIEAEVLASTSGRIIRGYMRERTGGSPARVSDPWVAYSTTASTYAGQSSALHITHVTYYPTLTDVSMLFSMRGFGTAHTPHLAYMQVEDIGPYIPNSGAYSTGGAVPSGGGTPDPEPVVTKKYTSTWKASDSQAYIGSGAQRTSPDIVQGYSPYYTSGGHQRSAVVFNSGAVSGETGKTIATALNGATLEKAEVYLYFDHWHYGSGGTALLGSLGSATIPSSGSGISYSKAVSGWARGQGRWVTIPTSWISTTKRGITIGGGTSTNPLYYGRADGASESRKPQLRLTYTR